MGTSKVYGSPKWPGVNRAVGQAVSSGSPSGQGISAAVGAFAGAYNSYLGSGTLGSSSAGSGSGGAARHHAAISGAQLGKFVSIVKKSGLDSALREFNLSDIRNKPLDEFLDSIVERLSYHGGLLDDESLNRAMAETVNELTETVESVDEFDELYSREDIDVEAVLQIFYSHVLASNFEQKEYSIVREKMSLEETNTFFDRARDIIQSIVRDELTTERDLSTLDWNSLAGQRIADEINQEVMRILIP